MLSPAPCPLPPGAYTDDDWLLLLGLVQHLKDVGWSPWLLAAAREWSAASSFGYSFRPLGRRGGYERGLWVPERMQHRG